MKVEITYPGTGITRTEEWNRVDIERHIAPEARHRFENGERLRATGPATIVTYQRAD